MEDLRDFQARVAGSGDRGSYKGGLMFWTRGNELRRVIFLLASAFAADLAGFRASFAQQPGARIETPAGGTLSLPANWELAATQYRGALEVILPASSATAGVRGIQARVLITAEPQESHVDALRRVANIAAEVSQPAEFNTVSSWPAVHRRYEVPLEHPNEEIRPAGEPPSARVTVAIAMQNQLVRIEAAMAPGADSSVIDQAEQIARSITFTAKENPEIADQDLQLLRKGRFLQRRPSTRSGNFAPPMPLKMQAGIPNPGPVIELSNRNGELEIAASNDGQNVVIVTNNGYSFSNDFGAHFAFGTGANAPFGADGDPSVAFGASGTFYFGFIGFPPGNLDGIGISASSPPSNGRTFVFVANAFTCPAPAGGGICLDQPHVAADRTNTAMGQDQIYAVWRNFQNFGTPMIVCSQNGGATWSGPVVVGQGDFPRISVAPDGFVYVTFRQNMNLVVSKFSQCSAGLALQFTKTIDNVPNEGLMCPLPGLDRCLGSNTLSSHVLAADDTNANHLYVAFADYNGPNPNLTTLGNANIIVRDSPDGGKTWRGRQVINSAVAAPRFMPWVCAASGTAYVTWYDRRAATAATAKNDLTDYYLAGISIPAQQTGPMFNVTLQPEVNLSVNPDPQCAGGTQGAASWPGGVVFSADSERCSIQPQLGGRCLVPTTRQGSQQPCDFDEGPACPNANEVCATVGGAPKYGDYNGNTCAAGRIFTAWASGAAPPGLRQPNGIRVVTSTIVLPRLTVTKVVQPSPDQGRFDLQIDGNTSVANIGDQGSTGKQTVNPGSHTVGETLSSQTDPVYVESIGGDCTQDGTVTLGFDESKTCTITNTRLDCAEQCQLDFEACVEESGRPPAPTPAECLAALHACNARCRGQ